MKVIIDKIKITKEIIEVFNKNLNVDMSIIQVLYHCTRSFLPNNQIRCYIDTVLMPEFEIIKQDLYFHKTNFQRIDFLTKLLDKLQNDIN